MKSASLHRKKLQINKIKKLDKNELPVVLCLIDTVY